MATLHLMVGLPCSGKTTYARLLAVEEKALLLTPDCWQIRLFDGDVYDEKHDQIHSTVETIMWEVAKRVLELGTSVILDFGLWAREERDDFKQQAKNLGVHCKLHYMDVPREELFCRLEARNAALPEGVFFIPREFMENYMELFTPPSTEELLGSF